MKNAGIVSFQESLSIRVGIFLQTHGFDTASCTGSAQRESYEDNSLGILIKNTYAKPKKFLFGLLKIESPRIFLGTIWFNNALRGATENRWILEMYGREHIETVKQLAEELSSSFSSNIEICLKDEEPHFEMLDSDIGP